MKGLLQVAGLGVVVVVLQSALFQLLLPTLPALCPDLVLVFALSMGLRARGVSGLVLAFGSGLLVDITIAGSQPGLYALLRGTACASTRLFDRALYLRAGGPWALYVAFYVVVDSLLLGVASRLFLDVAPFSWNALLWQTPGVALVTALCAAPSLSVFLRLDTGGSRETGWGLLASRVP